MFDTNIKLKKFLLFAGDLLLLYFTLWLTLLVRYGSAKSWDEHIIPFSIVYLLWLLVLYIDGLYDFDFTKNKNAILNKLALSLAIGALLATAFFYFAQDRAFSIRPQRVLLINSFVSFIFLFVWRIFFYYSIQSPKFSNNLLIIGGNSLAHDIIKKISSSPQLGFSLKAILFLNSDTYQLPQHVRIFTNPKELPDIAKQYGIRTIVFSEKLKNQENILQELSSCLPLNIVFYEISTFYEKITGKVPVDFIQHIWFLENLHEGTMRIYEISKRLFDIIASLFLLAILLPIAPAIILAIRANSTGPFLFRQTRVGKNGREFTAMKFRTMQLDAENTGPQWAQKNDPRITRVGKFLRKTRLDEIPQLVNVLRGEMSLIGPRPERPEFVKELRMKIPFYGERLLIKPGLTGWAQVMGPAYGGSLEETLEKIQYDLFYIKNRSLGLDLSITLKTIKTILSGKGQ